MAMLFSVIKRKLSSAPSATMRGLSTQDPSLMRDCRAFRRPSGILIHRYADESCTKKEALHGPSTQRIAGTLRVSCPWGFRVYRKSTSSSGRPELSMRFEPE